jgi:hypothetical protein
MSPKEPDRLGYVTESTDREMDLRSRDRAVLGGLCRVFGYCLLVLSVLAAVAALQVISAPIRSDMRLVIFAGMVLSVLAPGCTFLVCARTIRAGGTASVVVAMIVGLAGLFVTTLIVVGSAMAAWNNRARAATPSRFVPPTAARPG